MDKKQFSIIVGFLILILISPWISRHSFNINITRNYSDSTYIQTIDGLKGKVCWTTQYEAPLILSKDIKQEAQSKIKLYADISIKTFFVTQLSHPLSDMKVNEIQIKFDEMDAMQRKFASMLHLEGFEKLKNLKIIKFDNIKFENHREPDSLKNVMTTNI